MGRICQRECGGAPSHISQVWVKERILGKNVGGLMYRLDRCPLSRNMTSVSISYSTLVLPAGLYMVYMVTRPDAEFLSILNFLRSLTKAPVPSRRLDIYVHHA